MTKALNLQINDALYDAIAHVAMEEGMTKRQWAMRAMRRALPEKLREDVHLAIMREEGIALRVKGVRGKLNMGLEISESDKLLMRAYDKSKRGEQLDEQEVYAMIVGAKLTDQAIPREEEQDTSLIVE